MKNKKYTPWKVIMYMHYIKKTLILIIYFLHHVYILIIFYIIITLKKTIKQLEVVSFLLVSDF